MIKNMKYRIYEYAVFAYTPLVRLRDVMLRQQDLYLQSPVTVT
jgi:hypothetical protein